MTSERANSRPTKRRLDFQGLPVNVELDIGDTKAGVDDRGEAWSHVYAVPYGELPGTIGADGDPVDVYVGAAADAPLAFVVHQQTRDRLYDEDKVMLGFSNEAAAIEAYYAHGPAWGLQDVEGMTMAEFEHGYLAERRLPAVRL